MSNALPLNRGFLPIADSNARILILGSMPSIKSLKSQQYYAHPRNAFWPIMSALFEMDRELNYEMRCQILIDNYIAVWDVLETCQRQGSLDNAINPTSMTTNNFNLFLHQHPNIKKIVFNGAKAEQIFKRYALPTLTEQQIAIVRVRLPSTSPAHASCTFEDKLVIWRHVLAN